MGCTYLSTMVARNVLWQISISSGCTIALTLVQKNTENHTYTREVSAIIQ